MRTTARPASTMAIRLTLVSVGVIVIAFFLSQLVGYIRDVFLLQSGSPLDFVVAYARYMSISVLPVLVFFSAILFVLALRIQRPVIRLTAGSAGSISREAVARRMIGYRRVVVILNLLGFTVGHVLDFLLNNALADFFTYDNVLLLVRNLASGYVYAAVQLGIVDEIMTPARLSLRFHELPSGIRRGSTTKSQVVLMAATVIFVAAWINVGMTVSYRQEAVYAETLRSAVDGELEPAEAEAVYRERVLAIVLESSSRGAVALDDIPYPDDAVDLDYRVQAYRTSALLYLLFVCGVAVLAQALASRNLRRALESISGQMKELSAGEGDLRSRIHIINSDEIGEVASQMNAFIASLHDLMVRVRDAATMAAGSSGEVMLAVEDGKAVVGELVHASDEVRTEARRQMQDAESTTSVFDAMARGLDAITAQAEAQASFVEETSSSIEEMAASIQSVSDRANETSGLADRLNVLTAGGRAAVDRTAAAMEAIREASDETNAILQTISAIAAQTNLLSMNAAIEAAHAGANGAGFAVVAQEIRSLATNSGERAKEIREIVKSMNERIAAGAERTRETQSALQEVEEEVNRSQSLVAQISMAMQEQAAGTRQILSAATSMVEGIESIRSSIESERGESARLQESILQLLQISREVEESGAKQREIAGKVSALVDTIVERARGDGENARGLIAAVEQFRLG